MEKKRTTNAAPAIIDSLEALGAEKTRLREELDAVEGRMADVWHAMFHPGKDDEPASPTQRFMANISSASALIDGALLGWKLYRRLGGTFRLFRKLKK